MNMKKIALLLSTVFSLNGFAQTTAQVVLNTAAAFCVTDSVSTYEEGVELAQTLIDEGKAINTLNKLIKVSNE